MAPPPAAADEAAGNMQAAATRMARLASQLEDAAFQLATGMRTAKRHAARPTAKPPRRVRPPCHIEPPLQPAHSQMLEDSVWLLTGVTGGGADQKRRVLVWSAGTLRAFDPQTLQPAWQPSLIFKSQPSLLADNGCLIVHDRCRVTALQPGDGQVLWTWAGKGPDPQAPSVDPEAVPVILAAAAAADSILVATAGGRLACIDRHSGRLRWQRPGDPAFVGDLAVSEELAAYRGSQADRIVYRVFEAATGQDVCLLKPARDSPAESVEILSSEMVLLQGTNAIEAYDAYGGTLAWQVPARGRFRPAIRLHKGTAFYIGDGDRQLTKIDTRTGQATWWAVAPADTGSPVCLLDGDSVIWLIGERGAHVIDHATGKVVGTAALPPEVDPGVVIRYAAVCHAGVLCLAVKRSGCDPDVPPAVLALLPWHPTFSDTSRRRNAGSLDTGPLRRGSATQAPETHRADTTAALLARIDEATGPINGWDITDNAVWIAAGDRLITLRGQAKADP
jgi:outer membrane protein assembly factor BamB